MEYVSVAKMAEKWGLSERSVRNYCANGRIADAKLIGKIWYLFSIFQVFICIQVHAFLYKQTFFCYTQLRIIETNIFALRLICCI